MDQDLLQKLGKKEITKQQLFEAVESDFDLVPIVIEGVSSSKASIRYGCAKVLMDLSARHPEKLYPHMDFFISLLESKHRILIWNAMTIIANLCPVDAEKKFEAIFNKYYSFLSDEYMVTVANVVANSAKIALAKPHLVPKIADQLLSVEKISTSPHLTCECRRVIAQHAVKSFDQFFDKLDSDRKKKVIFFVRKQVHTSRTSLKKEAELFLKHWNPGERIFPKG